LLACGISAEWIPDRHKPRAPVSAGFVPLQLAGPAAVWGRAKKKGTERFVTQSIFLGWTLFTREIAIFEEQ